MSTDYSRDESSFSDDELQISHLWKQNLSGKRPVLIVSADIPAEALDNGIDVNQPKAVSFTLSTAEQLSLFLHLLPGGKAVNEM